MKTKTYLATMISDSTRKTVKLVVHSLFEAESRFELMAKKENLIVEDILEI